MCPETHLCIQIVKSFSCVGSQPFIAYLLNSLQHIILAFILSQTKLRGNSLTEADSAYPNLIEIKMMLCVYRGVTSPKHTSINEHIKKKKKSLVSEHFSFVLFVCCFLLFFFFGFFFFLCVFCFFFFIKIG